MRNNSFAHRENMHLSHFPGMLLAGAIVIGAAVSLCAGSAIAATIITFDVPGATDTEPSAINDNGEIVGFFEPQNISFLREPDGTISTFKVGGSAITSAAGINDKVQITGTSSKEDPNCFLRKGNGKAVSCTPLSQREAFGNAINVHGTVAGECFDGNNHGFLFDGEGSTVFDAPGAITTNARSINANGFVTGVWIDAAQVGHGFVRDAGGTVTEFDVPGSTRTDGRGINDLGTVVGFYIAADDNEHSFVRDSGGGITVFDPAGAVGSDASGVNKRGVVAGAWIDQVGATHGYVRRANGTVKSFDVPGAVSTAPAAINSSGEIAGFFVDASGQFHGFLRTP